MRPTLRLLELQMLAPSTIVRVMAILVEDERRVAIRQCLAREGLRLGKTQVDTFVARLSETLSVFLASRRQPQSTYRQLHEHMRRLWLYAHRDDCDAARLLVWMNCLPPEALARMDRRAAIVLPKLFPGAPTREGFLAWAAQANAEALIRAVSVLSADGAMPVVGRTQASGKRSRPRLEPLIANHVRGDKRFKPRGGRPGHAAQDALVRDLSINWLLAVGALPVFGRSDRTGFGDLVHTLFDLIDEPGATQALRRYAAELRRTKVAVTGER